MAPDLHDAVNGASNGTIGGAADPDGHVLELVIGEVDERSARGIAAAVSRLVSTQRLADGDRLPTVRRTARALGVSPSTVSDAWQRLAAVGAVQGRGRQGTFVCRPTGPGAPVRYRRITEGPGHFDVDLSTGTPDPALLPSVAAVIASLPEEALTASYLDPAVLPALEAHLVRSWPFVPETFTVVDGAMDALDRIASHIVRMGDRVIVEDPTFPPLLDLLDHLGAEVIGIPLDAHGMDPAALRRALAHQPRALFCQLRAQNPTGVTTTRARARELAQVLADSDVIVVEDDHAADIARKPLASIGATLPERTVHIRSFSKSHGPDLRLAGVGGMAEVVRAVVNRRMLGPGWSSRILQAVLLTMLTDPEVVRTVAHARDVYATRRRAVCRVLTRHGVTFAGQNGVNLWVRVRDERAAMLMLAAHGVGVAPGNPFHVSSHQRGGASGDWIRVTTAAIDEHDPTIAQLLAQAALVSPTWG